MAARQELPRRAKAIAGRLLVQGRLVTHGGSPFGLGRVWAYTDDCAGLPRHRPADPRQGSKHVFPGLAHEVWQAPASFGWTGRLAAATAAFRDEALAVRARSGFTDDAGDMLDPSWQVHLLRTLGEAPAADRGCPAIEEAVAGVPRLASTGLCHLASLAPGAEVPIGCAPTNTRVRFQLGLEVPDGCAVEVAGEAKRWREGEWLAFDDSYPNRAWNRSERPLMLLVVDVWHPGITDREARALEVFMRLSPESVQRRRRARERLGSRA